MKTVRRLTIVTTVATYLLVTVGGLVRATGSGLGCPDWPRCHGRFIPPFEFHALVEYSHRLTASIVIGLTVALAVAGFRARRELSPRVVGLAVATAPIVFSQALLGAVVVALDLHASSVVAHLLVAMTLLAVLIALLVETAPAGSAAAAPEAPDVAENAAVDRGFARAATAVAAAGLALMLLGSYVSGRGAGLAFTDWPTFGGRLIPATHTVLGDLHFAHRVLAAAVALSIFALARQARRRGQASPVVALVRAAGALIGIEIMIGAGNVWTRLSAATRTAHLATAALIWAVLFAAARLAWRLPAPAPSEAGPAGPTSPAASDAAPSPAPVGSAP
jgi:heme A synthase